MSKNAEQEINNEYINDCEMLVHDTVAELYNIEDSHNADLKLLTIHFFKCVAADLKLDIKID